MSKYDLIYKYMSENNGMISVKTAKKLGVQRQYLYNLVEKGKLERVNRGVFVDSDVFEDQLFSVQSRYSKGVFSHGTALYLHNLTDRTPLKYTMCFPTEYNISNVKDTGIDVYRSNKKMYGMSIVEVKTNQGNIVKTYSMEKTLCDIVRGNSRVDKEVIVEAFKRYSKKINKDVNLLFSCAKLLKVEKTVRGYMEVLL